MRVFAVQRLSLAAKLPERAYKSAGYDLFSLKDTIIWPKQLKIIPIGIAIEFDEDHVGLIWDKTSGANRNLHVPGRMGNHAVQRGVVAQAHPGR
jgi:dUTPase